MYVLPRLKLFLHQICNIVSLGNNQRPVTMSRGPMNVMSAIIEILFTGKGKIMLPQFTRHYEDSAAKRKRQESDFARNYQIDAINGNN